MEIQIVACIGVLAVLTQFAKAPLEKLQHKMMDATAKKLQTVLKTPVA